MKKLFWLLLLCALPCSGATIKLFTDYPNSTPVSSDFMLFQRNGTYFSSAQSQFLPVWFTDPVFTGNGSINGAFNVGGTLTVGGAVITGVTYYGDGAGLSNVASQVYLKNINDNGTNETFWDSVFNGTNVFQEIDAGNFYGTNFFTFITNSPFLKTDGDGKVVVGVFIPGTNLLLSAGDNITFATNSGTITIASSGTNTVSTITNSLLVTTNVIIYSNLTVLQNIYASTNFSTNLYSSYNFSTNLYASTNFSTNLYFLSGKGNRLIITNNLNLDYLTASKLVATDAAKNLTNADVAARFTFTGNVLDIASGSIPNADLVNSSLTIAGTANQVSVSGGGPVSLGGTATLSLPSPTLFPGKIAVTGITNTGETSMQGVETNTTMGTGLVHSDNNGKRTSSLLVNADITAGTIANASLANSSITIQSASVSLGGSTLAQGSKPVFDLQASTNLLLSSVSSPTNGVSTASSIDFTLPEAVTNIAGAVSQTSLLNFNPTNINHAIRYYVNRTGSDQTITVGTWETDSARLTATTYTCTNNTTLALMFSMYAGQFTNVTAYKTFR